jgi:hypothetical protein
MRFMEVQRRDVVPQHLQQRERVVVATMPAHDLVVLPAEAPEQVGIEEPAPLRPAALR